MSNLTITNVRSVKIVKTPIIQPTAADSSNNSPIKRLRIVVANGKIIQAQPKLAIDQPNPLTSTTSLIEESFSKFVGPYREYLKLSKIK